jgi:putative phage-type endonuclease
MRKTGIGGSDAGAICGLNPYSSPMKVYQDKTSSTISNEDNEAMRQGRDLEDYVARRFMEETGIKVRRSNYMYRNEEYPFMRMLTAL